MAGSWVESLAELVNLIKSIYFETPGIVYTLITLGILGYLAFKLLIEIIEHENMKERRENKLIDTIFEKKERPENKLVGTRLVKTEKKSKSYKRNQAIQKRPQITTIDRRKNLKNTAMNDAESDIKKNVLAFMTLQGGCDVTRFRVGKYLPCCICDKVPKDPRLCKNRGHIFCLAHISQHLQNSQTCPVCTDPLTLETLRRPTGFLKNYLDPLKIKCNLNNRGYPNVVHLKVGKYHVCKEIKASQDKIKTSQHELKIGKARSLALQFMSENPSCIRAIPYEREDVKSLIMCLYIDTNGKRIPDEIEMAANQMFKKYKIEFYNLCRRPLNKIVRQLPASKKEKAKELADLSRALEKNLHLFENRMNVTAVQASYKVTDSIERNIPCMTVFVLGKGEIPAGETDIKKIKEENSDIFDQAEFDVAEGYHKLTNGSSLEGYASPLEGGVGIGVQGGKGAGTLGGFLQDEEGNVYILSNEHVLNPPSAENVIVQPSEYDYEKKHKEAAQSLEQYSAKVNNIPESRPGMIKPLQEKIKKTKEILNEIKSQKPRSIGKYVCGLKDTFVVDGRNVYVDAAIASLDERELSDMRDNKMLENQTNCCPVYGFETDKYWKTENDDYQPPNGKTDDFKSFQERLSKENPDIRFMKIGRSTGFTDEGFIDIPEEVHLHCIHSTDVTNLLHVEFPFCKDCMRSVSNESEINANSNTDRDPNPGMNKDEKEVCKACGKELKSAGRMTSFWAQNCFAIRKLRRPFSDEGDSGALVFDQDGQAWGLVFSIFEDLTKNFVFSLISPLCVVIEALKAKSGKKELKLWCTPEEPLNKEHTTPESE